MNDLETNFKRSVGTIERPSFFLKWTVDVCRLILGIFVDEPTQSLIHSARRSENSIVSLRKRLVYQGCHGLWKSWKVLELAKENSRPWKVLEFSGLWSLKILEWAKFSLFTVENNETELFVIMGYDTFNVTTDENKNGGSIFPRNKSCSAHCWINLQNNKVILGTEGPWICS